MTISQLRNLPPEAIAQAIRENRPEGALEAVRTGKVTPKRYRCTKCGYVSTQNTNHTDKTWSWGHINTCPQCPPYKKYPEFGGQTVWECMEQAPA